MSLPTSRNTTYAPGSQVKSDDLNDIQDQIIALATFSGGTQGTFTPTLIAVGATVTHVVQQGHYLRVGNVVFFQIYIEATFDPVTSLGTFIRVPAVSLPFAPSAATVAFQACAVFSTVNDSLPLVGRIDASGITVYSQLVDIATDGGAMGSATYKLSFGGHYLTA